MSDLIKLLKIEHRKVTGERRIIHQNLLYRAITEIERLRKIEDAVLEPCSTGYEYDWLDAVAKAVASNPRPGE